MIDKPPSDEIPIRPTSLDDFRKADDRTQRALMWQELIRQGDMQIEQKVKADRMYDVIHGADEKPGLKGRVGRLESLAGGIIAMALTVLGIVGKMIWDGLKIAK